MMLMETALQRRLPAVSARGAVLLAGVGGVCLTMGIAAGAVLLLPAAAACALGLFTGLARAIRVARGRAYPREGKHVLAAAIFVNASMLVFLAVVAYVLHRFGP